MVDDEPGSGGGEEYDQHGHVGGDGDEQLLQLKLGGVRDWAALTAGTWGRWGFQPALTAGTWRDGWTGSSGRTTCTATSLVAETACAAVSTRVVLSSTVCTAVSVSLAAFKAASSDAAVLAALAAASALA